MMLENLFVQAAQGQAFLWLTAGGFLLGAAVQMTGPLRRKSRWLGYAADVLLSLLTGALLLAVLLRFGGGVRAYGLLGILIGLLLYWAGVAPVAAYACAVSAKLVKKCWHSSRPEEGFCDADREMITTNDAAGKE